MDKLSICIPLGKQSNWFDYELMYTLRSIDKHVKIPYDIFLFHDPRNKLDWVENVHKKPVKRYYPEKTQQHYNGVKHFENWFDVLHKIEAMVYDEDVSERFVLFYDDIHILRDVNDVTDFINFTAMQKYEDYPEGYELRKGKWAKTIMRAMDILKDKGRPRWDYETHLPRFFSKAKWKEIFKKFPPDEQLIPYAPSTLYYNWYYDKPMIDLMRDENNIKAGFYGDKLAARGDQASFFSSSKESIEEAIDGKMFMNHNEIGLTTELKQYIASLFPEKSRYEK